MSRDGLASTTRFLVLALSALYALAAVAGLALIDFDTTRSIVLWVPLTVGAALMLVGQLATPAGRLSASSYRSVPLWEASRSSGHCSYRSQSLR